MHVFISSVIKKKHVAWLWLVASRGARGAQNIWPWTRAGFLGFVWSKYHMSSLWGALGIHGPYKASLNIIEPHAGYCWILYRTRLILKTGFPNLSWNVIFRLLRIPEVITQQGWISQPKCSILPGTKMSWNWEFCTRKCSCKIPLSFPEKCSTFYTRNVVRIRSSEVTFVVEPPL